MMANHNGHLGEIYSQLKEGSLGMPETDYPEKAEVERLGHCGRHHFLSLVLDCIQRRTRSEWQLSSALIGWFKFCCPDLIMMDCIF